MASGIMDKQSLRDLLQGLYPMQSHAALEALSAAFLQEVDPNNQGYVSEDIFVAWVQSLPHETIESILNFPIIPSHLTFSKPLTSNANRVANIQDEQEPSEMQLLRVATEVITRKRSWKLLANQLGISETDGFHLEQDHLETKHQILKMLQRWQRTCHKAPLSILQAALRESGNADICNEVFQLSF